nr:hypothetical protein [Lactococcus hodotermopsidis]
MAEEVVNQERLATAGIFGGKTNYQEFLRQHLLVLEFFPYHSVKWSKKYVENDLTSQKYNFELLEYLMAQGKTVNAYKRAVAARCT